MFKYGFEEGNSSRKMNALFRNIIRLVISGYMRAVSQIVAIFLVFPCLRTDPVSVAPCVNLLFSPLPVGFLENPHVFVLNLFYPALTLLCSMIPYRVRRRR